jgi:hypothetical protein
MKFALFMSASWRPAVVLESASMAAQIMVCTVSSQLVRTVKMGKQ